MTDPEAPSERELERVLAETATGLWRLADRFDKQSTMDSDADGSRWRGARRQLERIVETLTDSGIRVEDHRGRPFHPGLPLEVVAYQPDAGAAAGDGDRRRAPLCVPGRDAHPAGPCRRRHPANGRRRTHERPSTTASISARPTAPSRVLRGVDTQIVKNNEDQETTPSAVWIDRRDRLLRRAGRAGAGRVRPGQHMPGVQAPHGHARARPSASPPAAAS